MVDRNKPPKVRVENLSVIYNQGEPNEVRALSKIDLEIFPEEYLIIYGPSGCGKSTLLYSIAGLQSPTRGKVFTDDKEIYAFNREEMVKYHQFMIGMIFQAFYLIPSLNVTNNVGLPRSATGETYIKRKGAVEALLDRFGILNQSKKFPSELSGGQKQRVSIARSLINNPDIILADEPVGNLDSVSAHNVMSILQELNLKDKKTVILITHDPAHLQYGDRIIYLKDGKKIKEEIIKRKKLEKDKEREIIETTEKVSPDLKMLMRAYSNLSLSQIGTLLLPFKAQELLTHILLTTTHEQMERAKTALKDALGSSHSMEDSFENLFISLDKNLEEGGVGWDKRRAKRFTKRAEEIIGVACSINLDEIEESSREIVRYLTGHFNLKLNTRQKGRMAKIIADRQNNLIHVNEIVKRLDVPFSKGGVGLNRTTSRKIAREIEIIMLIHYGR